MDASDFAKNGFALIPGVLAPAQCHALILEAESVGITGAGSRNLLEQPWCVTVAGMLRRHCTSLGLLSDEAVAVQCTLFEKSALKNWSVSPHQDLSIPVREHVPSPECTGWALKEGVLYTQPPARVLEDVTAIRVHLDSCPANCGPLRVMPGSHLHGRLSESEVERLRGAHSEIECVADLGAALIMRPLLLHSSPRMADAGVRRVLHFVFGPPALPCGLHWHSAV